MRLSRVKNQIIITTLVIMIATSGYISFKVSSQHAKEQTMTEATASGNVNEAKAQKKKSEELEDMEDAGEAVITSAKVVKDFIATARLKREQTRGKTKEELTKLIEDTTLSQEARDEASSALVEQTKYQEAEMEIETLLQAKGFGNVVVCISKKSVDVVVDCATLSDSELAKIQEAVVRKYDTEPKNIVITPIRVKKE